MIFRRSLTICVLLIGLCVLCSSKKSGSLLRPSHSSKNKKQSDSVIQPARPSYSGSVNKPPYPVSGGSPAYANRSKDQAPYPIYGGSVNIPPYPVDGGSVNKPPYPVSGGSVNKPPYPVSGGSVDKAPYPNYGGSVNRPPYPVPGGSITHTNGSMNKAPYPNYGGSAPYPSGSINKPPYPVPGGSNFSYPKGNKTGPFYNASYPISGKNNTKPSGSINNRPYPIQGGGSLPHAGGSVVYPSHSIPGGSVIFPHGSRIYPGSAKMIQSITIGGQVYLNGRSVKPTSVNSNTLKSQLCSNIQSAIRRDATLSNSFRSCALRKVSKDRVDTSINWDAQYLRPEFSSVLSNSFQSRVRSVILSQKPMNSYYYGTITKISGAHKMDGNFAVTLMLLLLVTSTHT